MGNDGAHRYGPGGRLISPPGTVGAVAMIDSIGIGADVARRDELLRQL